MCAIVSQAAVVFFSFLFFRFGKKIRFLSLLFQQNIFLLNGKTECEIMYHCSHCRLHCMG